MSGGQDVDERAAAGRLSWAEAIVPPAWSARVLQAAGRSVPVYGSAAWRALPDADPGKLAAVVRAAEAWRVQQATTVERLAAELADQRAADEALDAQAHADARRMVAAQLRAFDPAQRQRAARDERLWRAPALPVWCWTVEETCREAAWQASAGQPHTAAWRAAHTAARWLLAEALGPVATAGRLLGSASVWPHALAAAQAAAAGVGRVAA